MIRIGFLKWIVEKQNNIMMYLCTSEKLFKFTYTIETRTEIKSESEA